MHYPLWPQSGKDILEIGLEEWLILDHQGMFQGIWCSFHGVDLNLKSHSIAYSGDSQDLNFEENNQIGTSQHIQPSQSRRNQSKRQESKKYKEVFK